MGPPLGKNLTEYTLEELAQNPGTDLMKDWVQVEFLRRQTILQQEATEAAKETAKHTKRNSDYMLYSVVVLAVAAVAHGSRRQSPHPARHRRSELAR